MSDPRTGLAIFGFDPVAYFTDGTSQLGKADQEVGYAGVTWRFRNEGNRLAFVAHASIYMPRYGGYDPVAAARGRSVPGHPQIWLVHAERLYLFHDATARAAFAAEPERYIEAADRLWPEIERALSR